MNVCVLLVEDNPGDARLIKEFLSEAQASDTYELKHFVRMEDAVTFLKGDNDISVIISDIALPDSQGTQSFQKLRRAAADIPVIFCTGTHDEDMALSALQKGAQDYLLKGQFEGETLRRAIRYAIERMRFQKEVERIRRNANRLRRRATMLRKQSEQLIEMNGAKDDFISLASHQLRTPATGVKQYLGLILEGYAGDISNQQREFLDLAYESNERQLKIVSDLLRTAQLDAGQVNLKKSDTDLKELLRGIINEQSVQVRARDQRIKQETADVSPIVQADSSKLRMALENLIDNASKYTPRGKNIYVRLREDAGSAIVTIKDEGVGIDKDDLSRIFEKFSRVGNILSEQVGGSGLGLYWVHNIVGLHGGTITVDSEVGRGTSFVIKLPRS